MEDETGGPLFIPKTMSKIYDQMALLWGAYLTEEFESGNNQNLLAETQEVNKAMSGLEDALLNMVKAQLAAMEKVKQMEHEFKLSSLVLVTPAKPKPPKPKSNLPF